MNPKGYGGIEVWRLFFGSVLSGSRFCRKDLLHSAERREESRSLLKWEGAQVELQNIEAAVRRLFSDSEFRSTAIANPEAAFAAMDLRSDEQEALSKLCARLAIGEEVGASPMGIWF